MQAMTIDDVWGEGDDELVYAQGRVPERTYVSTGFVINRENSSDYGQPARFIHKVFDTDAESVAELVLQR
jgi:hypothetical protein